MDKTRVEAEIYEINNDVIKKLESVDQRLDEAVRLLAALVEINLQMLRDDYEADDDSGYDIPAGAHQPGGTMDMFDAAATLARGILNRKR
jgi:hypothetical protein